MLNLIQQLIFSNSIILAGIVAILVLASSGIITVYYTTQEEDQNKTISFTNTVFAMVAISITLLISFFAFWVMFCPNINLENPDDPIHGTIRMKAIAIFFMSIIGLIPSVDILVKRYLKPEEKHKDITTTEAVLVIGSSVISILIVLYMFIKFYLYVDPTALSSPMSSGGYGGGYGYGY